MGNAIYGKKTGDYVSYSVGQNTINVLIKEILKNTKDLNDNILRR